MAPGTLKTVTLTVTQIEGKTVAFCTLAPSTSLRKGQYFKTHVSQVYTQLVQVGCAFVKWINEEGDMGVTVLFLLLPQMEVFKVEMKSFTTFLSAEMCVPNLS